MVWVYVVHAGQNGLLVLLGRAAVQQSREAGVGVLTDGPFFLLAEVESFFGLEYLRGVGLLGLRGGDTWRRDSNSKDGGCKLRVSRFLPVPTSHECNIPLILLLLLKMPKTLQSCGQFGLNWP